MVLYSKNRCLHKIVINEMNCTLDNNRYLDRSVLLKSYKLYFAISI